MRAWADIPTRHRTLYRPCRVCGGPSSVKALACRNCSTAAKGEAHYAWKGDSALDRTKRERAQALYKLGPCERCGKQATDRHHKDANPGNNVPENIAILCRRCHMEIDGRLARLAKTVRPTKPPCPCQNCGRLYKPLRHGRCNACTEYKRRHGVERPATLYERRAA